MWFRAFWFFFPKKMFNCFTLSHAQRENLNSWTILNILWVSLRDTYPVLMEMISISGFFLIFGKSNRAPPKRFPLFFFWPSSLTEWPSNKTYKYTLASATELHFNLLLSNLLIFSFTFFFYETNNIYTYINIYVYIWEDVIIDLRNTAKAVCASCSQKCFAYNIYTFLLHSWQKQKYPQNVIP